MAEQAYVVHHIPGRVRVHVPKAKGNPGACKSINDLALSIPGIQRIQASALTGSVVVHYDSYDPQIAQCLAGTLEHLDALLAFFDPPSDDIEQHAGMPADQANNLADDIAGLAWLGDAVHRSGRYIRQVTRDSPDLATVLPLLFAGGSYLLMKESGSSLRSPVFLGGLVALSLRSFVTSQGAAADTASAD